MTTVRVTDILYIRTWDGERTAGKGLDIIDPTSHGGTASVYAAELPALLDRLTAAAESMGIETELVKALKEAQAYLVDHMPAHALGVIEQALASVK